VRLQADEESILEPFRLELSQSGTIPESDLFAPSGHGTPAVPGAKFFKSF
jgi:hypothetical protein